MLKYRMNSPFNKVFLYKNTTVLKKPESLIICQSPEHYNQLLGYDKEGLCELIGGENNKLNQLLI